MRKTLCDECGKDLGDESPSHGVALEIPGDRSCFLAIVPHLMRNAAQPCEVCHACIKKLVLEALRQVVA